MSQLTALRIDAAIDFLMVSILVGGAILFAVSVLSTLRKIVQQVSELQCDIANLREQLQLQRKPGETLNAS